MRLEEVRYTDGLDMWSSSRTIDTLEIDFRSSNSLVEITGWLEKFIHQYRSKCSDSFTIQIITHVEENAWASILAYLEKFLTSTPVFSHVILNFSHSSAGNTTANFFARMLQSPIKPLNLTFDYTETCITDLGIRAFAYMFRNGWGNDTHLILKPRHRGFSSYSEVSITVNAALNLLRSLTYENCADNLRISLLGVWVHREDSNELDVSIAEILKTCKSKNLYLEFGCWDLHKPIEIGRALSSGQYPDNLKLVFDFKDTGFKDSPDYSWAANWIMNSILQSPIIHGYSRGLKVKTGRPEFDAAIASCLGLFEISELSPYSAVINREEHNRNEFVQDFYTDRLEFTKMHQKDFSNSIRDQFLRERSQILQAYIPRALEHEGNSTLQKKELEILNEQTAYTQLKNSQETNFHITRMQEIIRKERDELNRSFMLERVAIRSAYLGPMLKDKATSILKARELEYATFEAQKAAYYQSESKPVIDKMNRLADRLRTETNCSVCMNVFLHHKPIGAQTDSNTGIQLPPAGFVECRILKPCEHLICATCLNTLYINARRAFTVLKCPQCRNTPTTSIPIN